MPVPRLPLEIVRLILERFWPDNLSEGFDIEHDETRKSLAPSVLVCKSWSLVALDVAWRDVWMSPSTMHRLVSLLLSRPDLLARVRVLRVKAASYDKSYDQRLDDIVYDDRRDWQGLTLLLHRAKRITVFELPAILPHSSLLATAAHAAVRTSITAIEVDLFPGGDVLQIDFAEFWDCLSRFPALTRLRVKDGTGIEIVDTATARPKLRIRHLTLDYGEARDPETTSAFRMLQQVDSAHLRSLAMLWPPTRIENPFDPLSALADLSGLTRLVLRVMDEEELADVLLRLYNILPRLTQLVELHVSCGDLAAAQSREMCPEKSPIPLRPLLDALPPSIRRYSISNLYFTDWKPTEPIPCMEHDIRNMTVASVILQVPEPPARSGPDECSGFWLARLSADPTDWHTLTAVSSSHAQWKYQR